MEKFISDKGQTIIRRLRIFMYLFYFFSPSTNAALLGNNYIS